MSQRLKGTRRHARPLVIVAGGLLALIAVQAPRAAAEQAPASSASSQQVRLGTYDPYGTFRNVGQIGIEHIYFPWVDADLNSLGAADRYAGARNRTVLLTIEPRSWSPYRNVTPKALHDGIMSGQYAGIIQRVCARAGRMKVAVTVRWGHEMDMRNGRYPWSRWSGPAYAKAYRKFVDTCRGAASGLKFMWSPRGEDDLGDYYPGDAYVDSVGMSIFALQRYDRDKFGRNRALREIVRPSYLRLRRYNKPIVLAEYGCVGDRRYRLNCHNELGLLGRLFPGVVAVVYFNENETHSWPKPYGRPDWRVPGWLVGKPVPAAGIANKASINAQ